MIGEGTIKSVQVLNPAAGSPVLITAPTAIGSETDQAKGFALQGRTWRLLYAWCTYTASAAAGNRLINVRLTDSTGNVLFEVTAAGPLIASDVKNVSVGNGVNTTGLTLSFPSEVMMLRGWSVSLGANGILAGDQISNCSAVVEEFFESGSRKE
jgi:hypothetical protein